MVRWTYILTLAGVVGACATVPMKAGPLIDGFSRAACVPARAPDRNGLLAWDYSDKARCHAHIVGTQRSTGSVVVEFPSDATRRDLMQFGEKSNPAEVRLDTAACRLYVKVNGSPILTNRPPTWLLEYDLLRREELQSAIVEPTALPKTCTETLDADTPVHRGVGAAALPEPAIAAQAPEPPKVPAPATADILKPIDLARWKQTPCLLGRTATQADVTAGRAVFATSGGGSRPIDLGLPRCALYVDQASGKKTPVVVIQAEETKGWKLVGYRFLGGGDGVGLLSDLELLEGPDERFR